METRGCHSSAWRSDSSRWSAQRQTCLILITGVPKEAITNGSAVLTVNVKDYMDQITTAVFRGTGPSQAFGVLAGEPIAPITMASTRQETKAKPTRRSPGRKS